LVGVLLGLGEDFDGLFGELGMVVGGVRYGYLSFFCSVIVYVCIVLDYGGLVVFWWCFVWVDL